jgi:putative transcriptional regulator
MAARRHRRCTGALGALLAAALLLGATGDGRGPADDFESHAGELLVADEGMPDQRFRRTVILLVRHDRDGALGLIVNRTLGQVPLAELLVAPPGRGGGDGFKRPVTVHFGGPVETDKGFVLHSREVAVEGTLLVPGDYAFTANPEILARIGEGKGPRRAMICIGYAGWGPGQLEGEVARGGWHWAPADEELVFGTADEGKWQKAMSKSGIDL